MILETLVQSGNVDCNPAITINENEVRQQLKHLKTNKASGPDNIHRRTLKACSGVFCSSITFLFVLVFIKNTCNVEDIMYCSNSKTW